MENEKKFYDDELEQNAPIHKIFEKERKKYIAEAGEQFEKPRFAEIEINGEELKIDYRIIAVEELENKNADPVLVLPGFGSGWEGIWHFLLLAKAEEL